MRQLSIASPPCVAEDFDGEVIVLNLDTGLYFSLPGLPGAIWRDINSGVPPEKILNDLSQADASLGRDAKKLIDSLVHHGLLRVVGETQNAPSHPEYVPMVGKGICDLTFTAHDDMKDLVMTDPIHDVDEAVGWPEPLSDHA